MNVSYNIGFTLILYGRNVRIKDIAKIAGVSPATVSRVLNNNPQVNSEARARVQEVVNQVGYVPNLVAQSLRRQNSNTILIVVPDLINPVFSSITNAITLYFNEKGYKTLLVISNSKDNRKSMIDQLLSSRVVDGAIFIASSISKPYYLELSELYPIVMCSEYFDDIEMENLSIDNRLAAYCLTNYLIEKGSKRFVYFHSKSESVSRKHRKLGIEQALAEHPGKSLECIFEPIQHNNENFCSQIQDFISSHSIDSMLINSDIHALFAMKAIRDSCKSIAVSSFDGTSYFELSNYAIPYIKQPFERIGIAAAEILFQKVQKKELKKEYQFNFMLVTT